MSERKRGIVCAYCGMAWGYEGETPSAELIKEACNHESVCEKNPYISQIRNLRRERDEARDALQKIAAFFARLYAPDILMGMSSADEVSDIGLWEDGE